MSISGISGNAGLVAFRHRSNLQTIGATGAQTVNTSQGGQAVPQAAPAGSRRRAEPARRRTASRPCSAAWRLEGSRKTLLGGLRWPGLASSPAARRGGRPGKLLRKQPHEPAAIGAVRRHDRRPERRGRDPKRARRRGFPSQRRPGVRFCHALKRRCILDGTRSGVRALGGFARHGPRRCPVRIHDRLEWPADGRAVGRSGGLQNRRRHLGLCHEGAAGRHGAATAGGDASAFRNNLASLLRSVQTGDMAGAQGAATAIQNALNSTESQSSSGKQAAASNASAAPRPSRLLRRQRLARSRTAASPRS